MITLEKVKIYASFNGDGDLYFQSKHSQPLIFGGNEWGLIDDLIQDYIIAKNGHASTSFIEALNEKALVICDSPETIDFLKSIAY